MAIAGARVFASVVLAIAFSAAAQERAPWKWTLEERLARRLDPTHMAERARNTPNPRAFVIDGRENPELFLPGELVRSLLDLLIPEVHRARTEAAFAAEIESFGWDPDVFWRDVQLSAGKYHTLLEKYPGAGRTEEISRMLCAEEIAALHELRRRYDRLDEFLYTAIAPRIAISSTYTPLSPERTRWLEGGCR